MTAGEICSRQVAVIRPGALVTEAAHLMRAAHAGALVVISDAHGVQVPIGIITDRDIALAIHRLLKLPQLKVADLMSVELVIATASEPIERAIDKMESYAVRRLPIVDDRGLLYGLLTLDDVVEIGSAELTAALRQAVMTQRRQRSPV